MAAEMEKVAVLVVLFFFSTLPRSLTLPLPFYPCSASLKIADRKDSYIPAIILQVSPSALLDWEHYWTPFCTKLWRHVSRPCNLIGWSIDRAQPDSHSCRKRQGIYLARQKVSNIMNIFLMALQGEFLTKISPNTWGNGWADCLARHFAQLFPHVCGGLKSRLFT